MTTRTALLRSRLAQVFSSPDALKQYLKDHPGADKAKHRVEKSRTPKEQKDHGDLVEAVMDNFDLEDSDKDLQRMVKDSRPPKEIADLAKGRLQSAEKAAEAIQNEGTRETVKKEFEKARSRSNKQLSTLEETLGKKMGDPKRARAVRDFMESSIMFKYVRDEVAREKRNKVKNKFNKKQALQTRLANLIRGRD